MDMETFKSIWKQLPKRDKIYFYLLALSIALAITAILLAATK